MTISTIRLGDHSIGPDFPPFIIAEMSGNHNQSLDRAFQLVDAAASAGAHALKLQTFTPDSITLDSDRNEFTITDKQSIWSGQKLYDLYQKAYTPWEWHQPIFERAKKLGLLCFSSPFDELAVDFLDDLGVPAFKIASFENNHIPLIQKAASTGKPLIISTGLASLSDLNRAVEAARSAGCQQIILLKCTSTYPASPENTNLRTIPHLRDLFSTQVGLSDHSMGVGVAVSSVALGASVIEKHFTLSRDEGGVDSAFSLEPDELNSLVVETRRAWQSLGYIQYGPTEAELQSLNFRRSIYVSADINRGETFTTSNLKIVRPGLGAPPYLLKHILGKTARQSYLAGTPLDFDQLL